MFGSLARAGVKGSAYFLRRKKKLRGTPNDGERSTYTRYIAVVTERLLESSPWSPRSAPQDESPAPKYNPCRVSKMTVYRRRMSEKGGGGVGGHSFIFACLESLAPSKTHFFRGRALLLLLTGAPTSTGGRDPPSLPA